MKKLNTVIVAVLFAVILVLSTVFAACTPNEPSAPDDSHDWDVCEHSLTRVAAVQESCTTDGHGEYWFCSRCGKYFSDGNAANEIDKNSTIIASHHTLTHKTEQKATCTTDGNVDYFHCSVCGENFLDEACKNKIDLDDTVIASKGHVVGEQWEQDENGHWKVCGACGQQVDYHVHNFEDYVCTDCGAVDETNRPLTEKEIVENVAKAFECNIQNLIGRSASVLNYLALNHVSIDKQHKIQILVDYLSSKTGIEEEYYSLLEFPMTNELTQENVKNNLCQPTSINTGERLIHFRKNSDDPRGIDILEKIDPAGDHDHYDFVSVTIGSGLIIPNIGVTNNVSVYTINKHGVDFISVCAKRDGGIKDCIGESILNGINEQTYSINTSSQKNFEFGDNAIYNFGGLL